IGAWHDQAVKAAAFEFGAQGGEPRGAGGAFAAVFERLESSFEHDRNLRARSGADNGGALEHQGGPAVDLDPPLQSEMRISGARGAGLGGQQSRQNDVAARRDNPG